MARAAQVGLDAVEEHLEEDVVPRGAGRRRRPRKRPRRERLGAQIIGRFVARDLDASVRAHQVAHGRAQQVSVDAQRGRIGARGGGGHAQELLAIARDRFERRAGEWKVADRVVAFDEVQRSMVRDELPEGFVRSRRDRTDPVYTRRKATT